VNVIPAQEVRRMVDIAAAEVHLTPAEARELRAMVAGLRYPESALAQGLAADTVRKRRRVIYRKLGVRGHGAAVARVVGLAGVWPEEAPGHALQTQKPCSDCGRNPGGWRGSKRGEVLCGPCIWKREGEPKDFSLPCGCRFVAYATALEPAVMQVVACPDHQHGEGGGR
jgi:DNA-binding CsgD family transcriptional regulator